MLPQLLRAFRGTPQTSTGETANMLMLGRELRLPDLLMSNPPPSDQQEHSEYVQRLVDRLEEAHALLREQQMTVRQDDGEEPPLFQTGDLVLVQNTRRRKGENPKLQPKFVGPYEVVAAFGNHTYQLERLGQTTTQNECRLKLYQACTERRGQAPGLLADKGCKTPGKNTKAKRQPNKHLGGYVEGRYMEPRVQLEYLPEPNVIPNERATNILENAEERIKLEGEITEEVDSNHSFSATTNEGRESDFTRNLLQDADVDNSLDENLLQEINNSHEYLGDDLLQDTDSVRERNLLQDTDVDNSSDENLLQEINNSQEEIIEQNLLQDAEGDNFTRDAIEQTLLQDAGVGDSSDEDIEQYLELPASVTTRSGRVSKPPERLQDFFCGEINGPIIDEQTKNNGANKFFNPPTAHTDKMIMVFIISQLKNR